MRLALAEVHKSGLGSSAALVTSLVCALLLHFGVIPAIDLSEGQELSEGRRLAHNLAQFVHCFAQGKVGSGFDISTAVFGSQLYTRFDPAALDSLLNNESVCIFYLIPRFLSLTLLIVDSEATMATRPLTIQ